MGRCGQRIARNRRRDETGAHERIPSWTCGLASSGGSRPSRIELLRNYYFASRPSSPGSFPGHSSGLSNVGSASGDERPRESSCSWRTAHQPHPTSPTRTDCQRGCDHGRSGLRLDRTSRLASTHPEWRSMARASTRRCGGRWSTIHVPEPQNTMSGYRTLRSIARLRSRPSCASTTRSLSLTIRESRGVIRSGELLLVFLCPNNGQYVRTTDNVLRPRARSCAL